MPIKTTEADQEALPQIPAELLERSLSLGRFQRYHFICSQGLRQSA
jgi:hypothetical protein